MACLSGFEMRAVGFEPAAFWSVARRSIQLSYARTKRVMGIEPTYPAWKAGVLPLNYTRVISDTSDIISYLPTKINTYSLIFLIKTIFLIP